MGGTLGLLLAKGGPVIYPLLLCSVVALTFVIERAIFWIDLARKRDKEAVAQILQLAEEGDYKGAEEVASQSQDFIARVLFGGMAHREYSLSLALQMGAEEMTRRMRRLLPVLDTIITLAPLLGIFGTVLGIIQSFHFLGEAGLDRPQVVSAGIAQAIITTAAGLAIAILTLIPYNFFLSKVERALKEIEEFATILELTFERQRRKGS